MSEMNDPVEIMTDAWIAGGNYCEQTVTDLRDLVIALRTENERLKEAQEYAKKIMISSRAFEDARESFMYNSGIWLEKYGKD